MSISVDVASAPVDGIEGETRPLRVGEIIRDTEWHPSRVYGRDRPLVSVLLPTFRRGASGLFLRAAQSVLAQDLEELELIVVDDGSNDGTADQIADLMRSDARVSCLRHPRNVGLPAISEYEAFLKARADFLAFAFDDDLFYPTALSGLLDGIKQRGASCVHGYVELLVTDAQGDKHRIADFGRAPVIQASLRSNNYISNNAVLLHRRVFDEVGLYDPHICMARLCDWDLWRRIAQRFDLMAVDVAVGSVSGPSTRDSLGCTYLMEPWLTSEWMSMPRDQLLLPANYEDYDVLAMPSCLSREARLAIQEFRLEFGSRLQCQDSSEPAVRASGPDGHVLVIAASLDACTTLTFDQLPEPQRRRIRLIHDRAWQGSLPEEMVGASAVVFVRALFDFAPWIDHARSLGIPHYYSLDDNLMLLAAESRYWVQYGRYTDTEVREALKSFSGVLLSTPELIEYFRERQLHERLHYYPPVAKWDSRRASPSRQSPGVRIGFLGGPHRHEAFVREVLPAIRALGNRYELELIVMGVPAALLEGLDVKTVSLDYEHTHDLALRRMNAEGIDILVHPSSATANNRYKTLHVLINACAIGAAPILSNEPPYDILADEGSFALCDHDVDAWQRALVRFIESPALRARAVAAAERYCEAHYSGRANAEALDAILASHPSPGLVLRDARYRKLISSLKRNAATRSETPSILPVPVFSSMSYRVRPENGSVSELWTMLGSMTGGAISGEVRIEIIDPRSRAVLRQSSIQIEDLDDWSTYTFSFEKLETTGEDLILRFVPQTSGRLAVFETSTHCRRFWRRVLRKARLDLAGRDISYRLH